MGISSGYIGLWFLSKSIMAVNYIKYKTIPYLSSKIYINGKKSISKIINRITDVSLAFMYMDDGCLSLRKSKTGDCYSSREIHLNVQYHLPDTAQHRPLQCNLLSDTDSIHHPHIVS